MKPLKLLLPVIASVSALPLSAQNPRAASADFSIETRVTNYIQGGYDLKFFFHAPNTRMSYGLSIGGQRLEGLGKELVFEGENLDEISLRLSWVASALARYHLSPGDNGFFAEFSAGVEQFRAEYGSETRADVNGFISPAIGYLWFPFKKHAFYAMPKLSVNFLVFRPGMQSLGPAGYRLRAIHPSPSLSVGWRF